MFWVFQWWNIWDKLQESYSHVLSMRLRVISCASMQVGTLELKELSREQAHEHLVRVTHTIVLGNTWSRTTSLMNIAAIERAVKWCFKPMKWLYLDSLSTTARIVSKPRDLGRPSTKSVEMSSQTLSGMGKGCRRRGGLLLLTHIAPLHKLSTIFFHPLPIPFTYR